MEFFFRGSSARYENFCAASVRELQLNYLPEPLSAKCE